MQAYIGQLLLVPYNFAPVDWAFCQGQLIAISENTALFTLIGTTYGGDGVTTFQLPDLRSRTPLCIGQGQGLQNYVLGERGGVESVTLNTNQIPSHNHTFLGSNQNANLTVPTTATFATAGVNIYDNIDAPDTPLANNVCSMTGGNQPHSNIQPYLTLNWIISLFGIFPSQG